MYHIPGNIKLLMQILKTNLYEEYGLSKIKFEYRLESSSNEEFIDITTKDEKTATYEIRKGSIPGYLETVVEKLK